MEPLITSSLKSWNIFSHLFSDLQSQQTCMALSLNLSFEQISFICWQCSFSWRTFGFDKRGYSWIPNFDISYSVHFGLIAPELCVIPVWVFQTSQDLSAGDEAFHRNPFGAKEPTYPQPLPGKCTKLTHFSFQITFLCSSSCYMLSKVFRLVRYSDLVPPHYRLFTGKGAGYLVRWN